MELHKQISQLEKEIEFCKDQKLETENYDDKEEIRYLKGEIELFSAILQSLKNYSFLLEVKL